MEFVGIDWATRRAAWCAVDEKGSRLGEGVVPADEYGLMRLVAGRGPQVTATVEMMSGAAWIADTLRGAGWQVKVADARRARALAPLAAKTDKIDARVLAELARRDLVPEVWVPALGDRADLELLLRRMHLIRLRTSAKNRIFGLLTQWGVRAGVAHLRSPGAIEELAERGVPETWRDSIAEAVAVIELLDRRLEPIDERLLEVARADDAGATAAHDPRRRLAARPDLRRGDRRRLAVPLGGQAGRLLRPRPPGQPVGRELADRSALAGRVAAAALGRGRGRPARLARAEPLAPALRRRPRPARPRQRGEVRGRPQGPDRGLARVVAPGTLQACRRLRGGSHCPGKLRPAPGRLTARLRIEKPGQLRSDTMRRPSAERELSTTSASPDHGGTCTHRA